ncbi:MAG: VTT domain-containing protein [Nitrososphaerota archaeon]
MIHEISKLIYDLALNYGYLGIFLISIIGSLIPFIPFPYLFIVVILSRTLNPLLLGVFAGIGGAIGKITSYLVGRTSYRLLSNSTKKQMEAMKKLIGRYGYIGVFIFAVTPLPDDIYYIPMGMARLDFWKFLIASVAGKIVLGVLTAYLGRAYFWLFSHFTGESLIGTIPAIITLIIITVVMLRIDWEYVLKIYQESGIKGVLSNLGLVLSLNRNRKGLK